MTKRLILMIFATICLAVPIVHSAETVKVLVLPFEIHPPGKFSYLTSEIPKVIGEGLKKDGADLLTPGKDAEELLKTKGRDPEALRELGIREGADYVIRGSLTWSDQVFILEATLVATREESAPETFVQEGEGTESLPVSVTAVTRDMGDRIFQQKKIVGIKIVGNDRVESKAIERVIRSKPGEVYSAGTIPEDIKAIHNMGYFDDIRAVAEDTSEGVSLVFTVKEKPTIRQVLINGNRVFEDNEIIKELDISTGSILNTNKVQRGLDAIRELYKDKNYQNIVVKYSVRLLQNNQADLIFTIQEGNKIFVTNIIFEGNVGYTDKQLKDVIKTSEKGFFSWITSSGDLKRDNLEEDILRLRAYYQNSGYVSADVHEPEITYGDEGISITIRIDEGPRFRVGQVNIAGDLIEDKAAMIKRANIANEAYYDRETMENDIIAFTDLYADAGFAFAEITPEIDRNEEKKLVNITYAINKGKQVYFEKINITGNTKTRDEVIRRELLVEEKKLFSGKALKRSIRNLHMLGIFESDIKVETTKGSADDMMVLDIKVTERSTTSFNFFGAYSDYEGAFIEGWFQDRNFLGRGNDFRVGLSLGRISDSYYLRYIEPWLFGIPLSGGIEIYKQDIDYISYDVSYSGFTLATSYPFSDFFRMYLSYRYEENELSNFTWFVPDSVLDLTYSDTASSVSATLRYDSRDRWFDPTKGGVHAITFEYAGLGGNVGFTKTEVESGYYIPIRDRLIGRLHGRGGYVHETSGKKLPDYKKFYLGGIDSMRGFDYLSIGVETVNAIGLHTIVGGNKYVLMNFELLYTLSKESGMVFVLFYDTGNVFADYEHLDLGRLRQSAGFGFRIYSPLGLIRIENGYILDPKPGEDSKGKWVFTIGSTF